MAKKQTDETLVDVAEVYSKTESFVNDNGKVITTIFIAVIAGLLAYFGYQKFMVEPQAEEAAQLVWKAEYYFGVDSLDKALNGDQFGNPGFLELADDYGNTPTGNLAHHYAGVIYLNQGNYSDAVQHLSEASFDDVMMESARLGAIGDAHAELGELDQAAKAYKSSVAYSDNELTAPMYLKKLGLVQQEQGDHAGALSSFERIKKDFPNTNIGRSIDAYIAKSAALAK